MRLHTLQPRPGAKHRRKRVGRGESSGWGRTSGRGEKGAGQRAGNSTRPGFEGGQMPLIRKLPKRGFSNDRHRISYLVVNVADLNRFDDGATVDLDAIFGAGLANGGGFNRVKILGQGTLEKKLSVKAHAFSASAKAQIEGKGGSCEVVGAPEAASEEEGK